MRKLAPLDSLPEDLTTYWAAFWFLNQGRVYGPTGAPCGLSMLEKKAYIDEQGIDDKEERRRYMRFMSALDTAYITHFIKKLKAAHNA